MLNTHASSDLTQMGPPYRPASDGTVFRTQDAGEAENDNGPALHTDSQEDQKRQIEEEEITWGGNRIAAQRLRQRIQEEEGCTSAIDCDVLPESPVRRTTSKTHALV